MKRLHVNVAVADLDASVRFYSSLFDAAPSVLKPDYARWMLDDPRVNFAISAHGHEHGIDHLGIQVESDAELDALHGRLQRDGFSPAEQRGAQCCYARSDKGWTMDPSGVRWETFLTHGEAPVYGADHAPQPGADDGAVRRSGAACCG